MNLSCAQGLRSSIPRSHANSVGQAELAGGVDDFGTVADLTSDLRRSIFFQFRAPLFSFDVQHRSTGVKPEGNWRNCPVTRCVQGNGRVDETE